MTLKKLLVLSIFLCCQFAQGAKSFDRSVIKGVDVVTGQSVTPAVKGRQGLVVVFLSAVCPCSNSHLQELAALAREYPAYAFIGVHSNSDEKKEPTQAYFEKAKLPFPVIQDEGSKIADELKAYKTPHAFVATLKGDVVYQGGVSDSHDLTSSSRKYLREALEDLAGHRPVRTPEARTLGCVISHGEKNVW